MISPKGAGSAIRPKEAGSVIRPKRAGSAIRPKGAGSAIRPEGAERVITPKGVGSTMLEIFKASKRKQMLSLQNSNGTLCRLNYNTNKAKAIGTEKSKHPPEVLLDDA